MRIGIDISQIVYEGTGVAKYVRRMVAELLKQDQRNEYVLFGASLRQRAKFADFYQEIVKLNKKSRLIVWPIPPTLLDILWNKLHIFPIEWLIGKVDVFWSSDWTQPPLLNAKGLTTIHDLSIFRYPEESHNKSELDISGGRISANIVNTQKKRLLHAAKICQVFFCDSLATKKDAVKLLGIAQEKLKVVYPGY